MSDEQLHDRQLRLAKILEKIFSNEVGLPTSFSQILGSETVTVKNACESLSALSVSGIDKLETRAKHILNEVADDVRYSPNYSDDERELITGLLRPDINEIITLLKQKKEEAPFDSAAQKLEQLEKVRDAITTLRGWKLAFDSSVRLPHSKEIQESVSYFDRMKEGGNALISVVEKFDELFEESFDENIPKPDYGKILHQLQSFVDDMERYLRDVTVDIVSIEKIQGNQPERGRNV